MSPLRGDSARWAHGGAAALGFPRGEAVATIGSSQPIVVTEEERRNVSTLFAKTVKGLGNKDSLLCLLICTAYLSFCIAIPLPTSLRSATFPPGEGIGAPAPGRQTTIYNPMGADRNISEKFEYCGKICTNSRSTRSGFCFFSGLPRTDSAKDVCSFIGSYDHIKQLINI